MAFTRVWTNGTTEADPADGDDASVGAQEIREFKTDVRERLDTDHLFGSATADSAYHKKATLIHTTTPTTVAGHVILFSKSDDLLYYVEGGGTERVVVSVDGTQTLTGKTLTSPTITTPTITGPTITGGASITGTATLATVDVTALFHSTDTTDASSSISAAALRTNGGLSVLKTAWAANLTADTQITVLSATNATSSTTGPLRSAGGLGVARDIYSGGHIIAAASVASNTLAVASTATITGLFTANGGVLSDGYVIINGNTSIGSATELATSGTTGSLHLKIGTPPSTMTADVFALTSVDENGAGTAWPKFTTEDLSKGFAVLSLQAGMLCTRLSMAWNMETTTIVSVAHGLTLSQIKGITWSFTNTTTTYTSHSNIAVWADASNVNMSRDVGGSFVTSTWAAVTAYVLVWYNP